MLQDPRKFITTSDYPMDFVVWSAEGQLTDIPGNGQSENTIAHGLPYTPLTFGVLSADGGETWEAFGPEHTGFWSWMETDSTNVKVILSTRSEPVTILFKIWAYAPSDGAGLVSTPNVGAEYNVYHIDSDLDYSKLVKVGVWDIVKGSEVVVYNHNLGFVPQIATWEEYDSGIVWDGANETSTDVSKEYISYMRVDENNLYARVDGDIDTQLGDLVRFHYRIYGNEMEE